MKTAAEESKPRILVIEDEVDLRDVLTFRISEAGYDVRTAEDGKGGLTQVQQFAPKLVLLDLMLSDMSGLEVCRRIRGMRLDQQPAVIMLTARVDEIDRVMGFEMGANDYVVKPFSVRELLLRISAQLAGPTRNISEAPQPVRSYSLGGVLAIDLDGHRVTVDGDEIPISPLEMRLLVYLIQKTGHVCSRRDLLTHVWHYSPGVSSRTVDTHMKRLRDKLGAAGPLFETVRGLGYRVSAGS